MGFALWIEDDEPSGGQAWAQGTHEYKPMGAAVIAASDRFRQRDFIPRRRCPARLDRRFIGLFASLNDVNAFLEKYRQTKPKRGRRPDRLTVPYIGQNGFGSP